MRSRSKWEWAKWEWAKWEWAKWEWAKWERAKWEWAKWEALGLSLTLAVHSRATPSRWGAPLTHQLGAHGLTHAVSL